jgi:uncharacterized membrane protein YphA (DoxX/SURF4 family)
MRAEDIECTGSSGPMLVPAGSRVKRLLTILGSTAGTAVIVTTHHQGEARMERLREIAHNLLRIMAGIMFFSHGAQKLLGWFGGFGPDGGTVERLWPFGAQKLLGWFGGFGPDGGTVERLWPFGVAGAIESVGGTLMTLGIFTQPAAFIM